MKKRISLISFVLAVLLLLPMLVCCASDGSQEETTLPDSSSAENTSADISETTRFPEYFGPSSDFLFTSESVLSEQSYASYTDFLERAEAEYLVPALAQKIVPQGMDIWEERGWLMISGYFSDTSYSDSSALLAVDMESGEYVGEYYLTNIDGTPHDSHVGGVAVTSKNIFIANASKLYRISLDQLLTVGQCGRLTVEEEIPVPARASFCNYSGGYLWVGDFYYGTSYPTDTYRHLKNREGKMYYAWSVGYLLEDTESEIKAEVRVAESFATPDVVLSIDDRIQGFAVMSEDKIALSQSYGRTSSSTIFLYDNPIGKSAHGEVTLNGVSVPVYFLDGKLKFEKIGAPPMSEGLAAAEGNLYILFESGADKYANGGGKAPTEHVWRLGE